MIMKKILSILALAGLVATSCVKEEPFVQFNPEEAVAPTLAEVTGTALSAESAPITTTFGEADFGFTSAKAYELQISTTEDFATAEKLSASIAKGEISIEAKALNSAILNFGGSADTEFTVYFRLSAFIADNTNNAISSTKIVSNVVSATFIPYDMLVMDKDTYPFIYVIGNYCGWDHKGAKIQYLYNYNKDSKTYTGVVDFEDKAADGFKLTGGPDWEHGNWGSVAQEEEPEQTSISLLDDGGSKDIKAYSKRFYQFSFDKSSLTLTKVSGFDKVGIIGGFNEWGGDVEMQYNRTYVRFYADLELAADTELKFRADSDWALNWGDKCDVNGGNIAVKAGNYRVYLDLNKKEIRFDSKMYQQEEPGTAIQEPEPEEPAPYQGWGVTGSIASANINWDGDIAMTEASGVWTAYATLATTDAFKFRKDADWAENYGAAGDVEPFVITDGTAFDAAAGGKNLAVPADGFYKLVLDTNNLKITVSNATVWGVIGDFNSWGGDSFMTLKDGKWVSEELSLEAGKGFKIRQNSGWDVNRGAEGDVEPFEVTVGTALKVVAGGKNLTVPATGKYIITYDPEAETILVENSLPQNCWSLIGEIGDSSWNKDFYMTQTDGLWISEAVELKAGKGFKVRFNNDWAENRGAAGDADPTSIAIGSSIAVVNNGKNLAAAEDGTYRVVYDPAKELLYFLGWSVIGQVNGANWDKDIIMTPADGVWTSAPFSVEGGFKIRFGLDWAVNRGATGDVEPFNVTLDTATDVVNNGKNLGIENASGKYVIVYDSKAEKVTISASK